MRIDVVTLFPELIGEVAKHGILGRALKQKVCEIRCWNPRDYTTDRHRTADDRPYGGGPGMVMMAGPLAKAILAAQQGREPAPKVVYLSPQGRQVRQPMLERASRQAGLILVCGRYEGVDERLVEAEVDEQWSIGDYVLAGGELPAMVLVEAMARLLPGALGNEASHEQDSFSDGLLDCGHYTRPEVYRDRAVPKVLLSGHHGDIRRWRLKQSLGRTWERRPDLLEGRKLSQQERTLLDEYKQETGAD